jgi:hypothetical protein
VTVKVSLLDRTLLQMRQGRTAERIIVPQATLRQKMHKDLDISNVATASTESMFIEIESTRYRRFIWGVTPLTDDYMVT